MYSICGCSVLAEHENDVSIGKIGLEPLNFYRGVALESFLYGYLR